MCWYRNKVLPTLWMRVSHIYGVNTRILPCKRKVCFLPCPCMLTTQDHFPTLVDAANSLNLEPGYVKYVFEVQKYKYVPQCSLLQLINILKKFRYLVFVREEQWRRTWQFVLDEFQGSRNGHCEMLVQKVTLGRVFLWVASISIIPTIICPYVHRTITFRRKSRKPWKASNKSMIFRISKNIGQKLLSYWSWNQRNPFSFSVVFLGPRDNAEFLTEIHIRCNSPASHAALPPQISKSPLGTHYSTALTKFRHN